MASLLELRAGSLSMRFCPQLAFLRHVTWHGTDGEPREILRGIFPAVRNQDWDTIPFTVSDLQLDVGEDHFRIAYRAECQSFPFHWRGEVIGNPQGQIRYHFAGEASGPLLKNRIGLCVLHPIQPCKGAPCRVDHPDGTVDERRFPRLISPHQPFGNMRAISYPVQGTARVSVEFDGEIFEMEDQRNWTDASYKTYSTPLELPFPVAMTGGSTVTHRVTVALETPSESAVASLPAAGGTPNSVSMLWPDAQTRPRIGLAMPGACNDVSPQAMEQLARMRLDHLRIDIDLQANDWESIANSALRIATAIGARLEVALLVDRSSAHKLGDHASWLLQNAANIACVLVLGRSDKATPDWLVEQYEREMASAAVESRPEIASAYGTDHYFAELNRSRPTLRRPTLRRSKSGAEPHVCYSINPQVHAFDELSLCETLEGQRETVESAAEIFAKRIVISPITLLPRFNPNATSDPPAQRSAQPPIDPRQASPFAAAWTVGSLGQLATNRHVASLTWYETVGPRGVMSDQGVPYPIGDVIAAVLGCQSCAGAAVSRPLELAALGLVQSDGRRDILLANMSDLEQRVSLEPSSPNAREIVLAPHQIESISWER